MQKIVLFLFLVLFFSSCFLLNAYKQSQFTFTQNGQAVSLPLVIPRGYVKEEKRDTAGVTLQTFYYTDGALFYAAYLTDTMVKLQPFNESLHQPQVSQNGARIYKGQDSTELFYREIRQGNLRFGYRYVPELFETQFDSATNFALQQGR